MNMTTINELNDISLLEIFSSLSYVSLKHLTQVFVNWSYLLNEEYSKRKGETQYLCYLSKNQTSDNFVLEDLKSQMERIRTQPELILGFSTKPVPKELFGLFDCNQINIITNGVVYGNPKEKRYLKVPSNGNFFGCLDDKRREQFGFSGISFTKYPDSMRVETFDNISKIKALTLDKSEYLGCLMIFIEKKSTKIDEMWEYFNSFKHKYAISACFVDEIQDKNGKSDFLALGFIGKSNKIKIKQVIIPNSSINEPRVYKNQEENIVKNMSRANLELNGTKTTFAFQINSVQTKSQSYFNYNTSIELDVFKNFYPQVPLIGLNVDGLIGNEFYGDHSTEEPVTFKRLYNTTIFTIFSIDQD